jgi:hypothetical protein
MAGDGNAPLTTPGNHPDDLTLQEYALGQLEADREASVRQHLDGCPHCRARVREWQAFGERLAADLRRDLDRVTPGNPLDFDSVAGQWRLPRRQVPFVVAVRRLSYAVTLLAGVLLWLVISLLSGRGAAASRALALPDDYEGPPVVLATVTGDGLVVVRFGAGGARLEQHLSYVTHPTDLQLSPGGEWLAFAQDRRLHILGTRTGGVHLEIPLGGLAGWAWSPDGRALAYTDGTGGLWLFEGQTLSSRLLVPATDSVWGWPAWSLDGTQITYATAEPLPPAAGGATRQSLWRVEVLSGLRVELARRVSEAGVLLSPVAWLPPGDELLIAEASPADGEGLLNLYRLGVHDHVLVPLDGAVPGSGERVLWPPGPQAQVLIWDGRDLAIWHLLDRQKQPLAAQIPWPQALDWSADGTWFAGVLAGAPQGQGLYVYAVTIGTLRNVSLPAGATERAVVWGGPETLFVLRQPEGRAAEVWWLSLTGEGSSQRIMSGITLPDAGPYNGWRWNDVIAIRPLAIRA